MNPALGIAIFAAFSNLSIGFYIIYKNPKSIINRFFFLIILSIVLYNISEFFTRSSTTIEEALMWGKIGYNILWLTPCLALSFSLVFPKKINFNRYGNIFRYLITFIYVIGLILYLIFLNSVSIQNVKETDFGYRVVLSSSSYFIVVWFLLIFSFVIICLTYNLFFGELQKTEKKQIKILGSGGGLLIFISVGTNLLPPLFNFKIFPMTSVFSFVFVVFVSYAIIKYKFLSISPMLIAENILDTMNELVLVVNEKGNIINVNKSVLNLLGYPKRVILNSSLERIIRLSDYKKVESEGIFTSKPFAKLFDLRRLEETEMEFVDNTGKIIPMCVSASVIYDNSRNREGIVIVARNLTEIRKLFNQLENAKNKLEEKVNERTIELENINEKLRNLLIEREKAVKKIKKQNIQLKKLDELKTNFLNITSHELRTPITSIKGYIQMLIKNKFGKIDTEQKNALDIVLRNTDRLDHLVQDILDISRLSSGAMKFILMKTDIKTLVVETVESMQSIADSKNMTINTEVEEGLPMLFIDDNLIKQVFINLIDNSIKFSPDGTIINVKVRKDKNVILSEVQDFGRGIPEGKLDKVFDTFFQVDSGMDRKFGGIGLGLSISREIILNHSGRIWVESEEGEGCTFCFILPMASVQNIRGRIRDFDIISNNYVSDLEERKKFM